MSDSYLVQNREYHQIFTGTNQEHGYNTPVASFQGDTTLQVLKSDRQTYFHFPQTASITPLSAAGLIFAGAIPGTIPFYSDKIWKKNADYKKYIHWGDSTAPQTGVWLCSWLSASPIPSGEPVWMDRYYLPGSVVAGTYYYSSSAVYDEPSTMTLEPGVWYRYNHIGSEQNAHFVDTLSARGPDEVLVMNMPQWTGSMPFGEVPASEGATLFQSFTVTCQVEAGSWLVPDHSSVFSRGFRGGWDVKITNGLPTPLAVIVSDKNMLWINNNGAPLLRKTLTTSASAIDAIVDDELYTWILDADRLSKIDYNDTMTVSVEHSIVAPVQVFLNNDYHPCILDEATGSVTEYSKAGVLLNTYPGVIGSQYAEFNDTLLQYPDKFESVDSNAIWIKESNGISRVTSIETQTFLTDRVVRDFIIDEYDNLFILADDEYLIYFNTITNSIESTTQLSTSEQGARKIDLLYSTPLSDRSIALVTHENANLAYLVTHRGSVLRTINLTEFNIDPKIVSSGFSSNRRSRYVPYNKTNQVVGTLYFSTTAGQFLESVSLMYSCEHLTANGSHQIGLVYQHDTSELGLYVDSVLRDSAATPVAGIPLYRYETPIFFNTWPGRLNALSNELNAPWLHTSTRRIKDFRLYSYALDSYSLRLILNTHLPFYDIDWNIATGSQNYLEDIQRFFKNKLPGSKSAYYNITLTGLSITDPDLRRTVEAAIRNSVQKVAPAYTNLYRILWDGE